LLKRNLEENILLDDADENLSSRYELTRFLILGLSKERGYSTILSAG
jgi:hypothetical protein